MAPRLPASCCACAVEVSRGAADDSEARSHKGALDLFWWDGDGKAPRPLHGDWGPTPRLASGATVSTDGSFAAIDAKPAPPAPGQRARPRIVFVARDGRSAGRAGLELEPVEILGWRGQGRDLRAFVRSGFPDDPEAPARHFEVDPRTGRARAVEVGPAGPLEESERVSPDGRWRVSCDAPAELRIVERATGAARTFAIPPEDRAAIAERCPRWASARYLEYRGAGVAGFLDARTLQVNDALAGEEGPADIGYASDFRFAFRHELGDDVSVAPIQGAAGDDRP